MRTSRKYLDVWGQGPALYDHKYEPECTVLIMVTACQHRILPDICAIYLATGIRILFHQRLKEILENFSMLISIREIKDLLPYGTYRQHGFQWPDP
jgi:hypothetical protein